MRLSVFSFFVAVMLLLLVIGCENPSGSTPGGQSGTEPGVTPVQPDTTPPGPVSGVSADPSAGQVILTWTDPAEPDLALVEVTWSPAEGMSQPIAVAAGATEATITGLAPETSYDFDITAVDTSGNRSAGAAVDATTIELLSSSPITIATPSAPETLAVADVNGDGLLDIIAGSTGFESVSWHENNSDGSFSSVDATVLQQKVKDVGAADIDGDGDIDLFSVSLSARAIPDRIAWYENSQGDGSEFVEHDISTSTDDANAPDDPHGVFAGDLDGDGDYDVVAVSYDDGRVVWFENSKDGADETGFSSGSDVANEVGGASSVALDDLDGDGDLDVVVTSETEHTVTWYANRLQEPEADFADGIDITTVLTNADEVLTADIDGDGDRDVVAVSRSSAGVVWYENDGEGNFGAGTDVSGDLEDTFSVSAGDVDGDGDVDLVFTTLRDATGPSPRVVWVENTDGSGTFASPSVVSANITSPVAVALIDIDGDGDLDVVACGANQILWFENQLVN
ncbi:MAG: FG-GAP-like repeat-containing protein [Spirochaetales bacterium]